MLPVKSKKPLRNNVRTGCITCKRRRVKCPEERPHCSRCVKAGFVCAGYAIPKTWIFESSTELQTDTEDIHSRSSTQSPSTSSSRSVSFTSHDTRISPYKSTISSPLQFGNSDPFNVFPVQLGPRETHLLRMYQVLVAPRFDRLGSRHVLRLPATTGWTYYGIRMEDEAAAYSLLARCAAMEHWKLNGPHTAPPTSLLKYVSNSQASLHRKVSMLDGLETPEIVYSIMWTSAILAMADLLMGSVNVHLYSSAMSRMIVRYVELIDHDVQPELILYPLYIDGIRSLLTITRPNVDMFKWFPRVFRSMWNKAAALCPHRKAAGLDQHVHSDIKDTTLHDIILHQREGRNPYLNLPYMKLDYTAAILIANTVRTQELLQYGRLINVAVDAKSHLNQLLTMSKRTPEMIQDQIATIYLSFSTILWMNLTSPTSFASNAMLDSSPGLLRQLKMAIMKSHVHESSLSYQDQQYAVAKLWALFVGVQAEWRRRDMQSTDLTCDEWFLEAFRKQVKSMRVHTWQHAVTVLQQIVYKDRLKPHISDWWHLILPAVKSESGTVC